jgi:hypothetical protein
MVPDVKAMSIAIDTHIDHHKKENSARLTQKDLDQLRDDLIGKLFEAISNSK